MINIYSNLFEYLFKKNTKLITGIKKDIKNKLIILEEKIFFKKRNIKGGIFNIVKNHINFNYSSSDIQNVCADLLLVLITYSLRDNKPSARL
jgi:hypothetical protein